MTDSSTLDRKRNEREFVKIVAALAALITLLPSLYALLASHAGGSYLGYEFNTDDHMVYAAWMRQAMSGQFLFDNRFTTDPQPGLTFHLLFLALGQFARFLGIALTTTIARAGFSALFVVLLFKLILKAGANQFTSKLAVSLVVLGGGIGFLVWHNFGQTLYRPAPGFLVSALSGKLPTDVWQPEGFVLPTMLTNCLFMASLCLILSCFLGFLEARESWKPVWGAAIGFGVLMNIHSYDALTVGLTMVGFAAATASRKQLTGPWLLRGITVAAGAILPALWFVHVLNNDPVFQARAATPTFSPNFRQVLFGYLFLIGLGLVGLWQRANGDLRRRLGVGLTVMLIAGLTALSFSAAPDAYFLSPVAWVLAFAIAIGAVVLLADEGPAINLITSWAIIGLIAIYFPALFQRKLTMGLSIPWAILSAFGIESLIRNQERTRRNLATTLAILLLGATSIRWLFREMLFIRNNVSSTTRHPVFLTPDIQKILVYLNNDPGRKVVLAVPGAAAPVLDEKGDSIPDEFSTPMLPDLAPFFSGLTGSYTYAGHWSETPNYGKRCGDMYRFFLKQPFGGVHTVMTDAERSQFVSDTGANYAVVPVSTTFTNFPVRAPEEIGEVVVPGSQFELIRLKR